MPVIGWLHTNSPEHEVAEREAFIRGVAAHGFVEGRNVAVEYCWVHGEYDRLPALAAELVHEVTAIFSGPLNSALAARKAASSIPIVFIVGVDPVAFGLVASLNKLGGNLTGVAELLGELWPANRNAKADTDRVQAAAKSAGLASTTLLAGIGGGIDAAVATIQQQKLDALLVGDDPYLRGQGSRLATQAMRRRIAAISFDRPFAEAGGLMAYGPSFPAIYRTSGDYKGRILEGARPAELPVEQSTESELVISHRTAKMLRLNVPPSLLAGANEVIQ